ncbi:hypothetical protein E6P09_06025 [Haloferax mediterranei ATCC 33500]|uniref:Uncharacterized protein n=1 Tax=Haloferax mediterranei (strain ATCC 33500 / DSM 1411 / JCM 8866 / NBRC 14739 / NCIMB 2177 / R-4) TaxID=523841 RepID=I3R262_HALMT|nr:hypothetical protein [Haloferax mediterranei]AFK18322.1 hypothetical protein HFX_0597 [Haloferax mediterranei ATCC 33500]AHZ22281.1 hypothetical protein BM92_06275 [Haloferax mediterranei ATCC 33500]EMA02408.1 hypothetical protein C439_07495 [Haloferax mediterranei ATCC 33500]MDX5988410.1 hypothetical protein [Haloferax mediterranei ATCC 33500]QCQ74837.1 hypothetical protein E6P09_06025 [Haloferax mediterranei ATCC 33500]
MSRVLTQLNGTARTRAQSNVVGVALLLGIGVVAIGLLTASVGTLVDAQVATADADAAVEGFTDLRDGVFAGANGSHPVRVTDGDLSRVNRTVRILSESGTNRTYDADGYAAELGGHRVAFVGGAVARGTGESATLATPVPLSLAGDAAFLALPVLTTNSTDGGGLGSGATLRTRTNRTVVDLPTDTYTVAIETAVPSAWERAFERRGFTPTRTDYDDDGVESVVVAVPDDRTLTLARYDLTVVVDRG